MRAAVQRVAPGVPAYDLRPMEERLRESLAQERFNTLLLVSLGVVGLLLAAVGIYGIVSYFVAAPHGRVRRPHGARRDGARHRRSSPRGTACRRSLIGLAAGIAAALAATRLAAARRCAA